MSNEITPEIVAQHGLKPEEYERFAKLIGRVPTITELGIVSAMWNEHCSYKSSKKWLRTLPTMGAKVMQGPGENAGVVDIGDGQAIVFKMESHNHPSYIEPYQAATTAAAAFFAAASPMGPLPSACSTPWAFAPPGIPRTGHLSSALVPAAGATA